MIIAISLLIADNRIGAFSKVRQYLDTAVSPFYFLANGPRRFLDQLSETFATRERLQFENQALRKSFLFAVVKVSYWNNLNKKMPAYENYLVHLYVKMSK